MELKLFELRDRATFIPLLCIKPQAGETDAFSAKMAWRYGYKDTQAVIVFHMGAPERGCQSDAYNWHDRTFQTAHLYIRDHWSELKTGDLIDVEFILGETDKPCESEA